MFYVLCKKGGKLHGGGAPTPPRQRFMMIAILQSFLDICLYPLYRINIDDSFLGVLCYMILVAFVFHYFFYVFDGLKSLFMDTMGRFGE